VALAVGSPRRLEVANRDAILANVQKAFNAHRQADGNDPRASEDLRRALQEAILLGVTMRKLVNETSLTEKDVYEFAPRRRIRKRPT
jgi:hypothetical protein